MLKMTFFYLKSEINEKISEEFFCFLFFSVAHMFLKTNSTVRKNGIFDSLWGGIQRCVYIKEETKKGLYLKFHQNRSMRSPSTMRAFVKFVSVKMAASRWLIFLCAKRFTRCSRLSKSSKKLNSS